MTDNRWPRAVFFSLAATVVVAGAILSTPRKTSAAMEPVALPELTVTVPLWEKDTLTGRSGKLWMRLVSRDKSRGIPALGSLFGDSVLGRPGVYTTVDSVTGQPFSFVTLVPFDAKVKGRIGSYRMGSWPAERRGGALAGPYANPAGFIEVTTENQNTPVSQHFRLRDFLTKDQFTVWPKYMVLSEALIDKLELVIERLSQHSVPSARLSVMSGFRTPQYNDQGVGAGGRASASRHQYGDAADVFVDVDGDGRMDDLNGDGRVNTQDAARLARVVDGVERDHPDLVGGVGIYAANSAHGPFVHVDVRGVRARW